MSKHIPNLITISNLICGCIALYFTFKDELVFTAYLIGLAAIFDFMDGAVARFLNISNPIGKELDSLADMVSFGLVPGAVVFHLLEESPLRQYSFMALIIPIFSAYRLAKFNVDENQNENLILKYCIVSLLFKILNCPASAPIHFFFNAGNVLKLNFCMEILRSFSLVLVVSLVTNGNACQIGEFKQSRNGKCPLGMAVVTDSATCSAITMLDQPVVLAAYTFSEFAL